MAKTKGIVSNKEQTNRNAYQEYLKMLKPGGKSSMKKAKTKYEWDKSTPETKQTLKRLARSN